MVTTLQALDLNQGKASSQQDISVTIWCQALLRGAQQSRSVQLLLKPFLLNGVRQLDTEAVAGKAAVLLQQAGRGGQDLREQRVDVVLEVGLLPGLAFDSLLKVDDRLDQVLKQLQRFQS